MELLRYLGLGLLGGGLFGMALAVVAYCIGR